MGGASSASEMILSAAARGIGAVTLRRGSLDDWLDRSAPAEYRRSVGDLLFAYFRYRKPIENAVDRLAVRPPREEVRFILLAAATQIVSQTAIAPQSAVNVAVDLVKRRFSRGEAGFVNALLRRIAATPPHGDGTPAELLPEPVLRRWSRRFEPERLAQLVKFILTPAEPVFRAERDFDPGVLAKRQVSGFGDFRFYVAEDFATLLNSEAFKRGDIYLQDPATSLAVSLPDYGAAGSAVDLCAAPGGKSLMMAERLPKAATLLAADRSERRQRLTRANFDRRGLLYRTVVAEPAELEGRFDLVLADVPCSNTGVSRRRPDVLWRFSEVELKKITDIQRNILDEAARLTAPGGQLVYSTCSIEPEENQELVKRFVQEHSDFRLVESRELLPENDHDGASAALLKRDAGLK
ncbi:MAG: RsmB/NOP family class I SAM-dependent RNA methyltransferase [Victivallaceae bacterium]|nr:RsmB/NOP family class I SAM-dependent RNA methyltransferase [Victivallaceae bacterium]